jgi:DNA sulfur modification protein DndD
VSKGGYLTFGLSALDETERQVAAARKRGDLPAKIKPQFVDDLLAAGLCICRRPISKESSELEALKLYRATTGLAELEERVATVSAEARTLRDRRLDVLRNCDEALGRMSNLRGKLRACREALSAINERIAGGEFGDEAEKLKDLIRLRQEDVARAQAAILRNGEKVEEAEAKISELREQNKRLTTQSEKAAKAKRQLEAVQRVADALSSIRDIQKEDVRISLDRLVSKIWTDAAIKAYDASVSEKFQLLLTKSVNGHRQPVLGLSTGEKQVLSLSFVGAMVRKARENVGRKSSDMPGTTESGGHYPLVMDSPFGSLEDEYRSKVAKWLPDLASQVVVMASKSQWRHEVEDAMRSRIGKEYILELHTSKQGADRVIEIEGREYPYVCYAGDGAEKTIIRKVL